MGSQLNLHAKVYYDDPNVHGGDEFYIDVPASSHVVIPVSGSSTGWRFDSGSVWDQQTPLGGYLHVYAKFNNCVHQGFSGAELILSSAISYWGSKPTGSYSQEVWQGELTGTAYKITRVTV